MPSADVVPWRSRLWPPGPTAHPRGPGGRQYLLWGGVVYLVLWLYGLFVGHDSPANFIPLNSADNWLHLGLGVTMVALSFLPRTSRTEAYPSTPGRPLPGPSS